MHNITIPIATKRLILRDFVATDSQYLQAIAEQTGFHFVLLDSTDSQTGEKLAARFMRENSEQDSGLRRHYRLAITVQDSGQLAGYIGLFNIDFNRRDAELGFFIAPAFQGNKYTIEAADSLIAAAWATPRLRSIYATVREDNAASRSILGKLGMKQDGIVPNKYQDDVATRLLMRVSSPTPL